MSGREDGGAAFLTDERAQHICIAIADGYRSGAFPINAEGELVSWYGWLRNEIADAMIAQREKSDG